MSALDRALRIARAEGGLIDDPMGAGLPPQLQPQDGDTPGLYDRAVDIAAKAAGNYGGHTAEAWKSGGDMMGESLKSLRGEEGRLPVNALWQYPLGAVQALSAPVTGAQGSIEDAATQATGNPEFGAQLGAVAGFADPSHVGAAGRLMHEVAPMAAMSVMPAASKFAKAAEEAAPAATAGRKYATSQDGPFYRVRPVDTGEGTGPLGEGRAAARPGPGADAGPAGPAGGGVPQPPPFEAVAPLIADREKNVPLRAAEQYSGAPIVRPDMPPSSLAKQSGIGRTFALAAEGSPAYKEAVFRAYQEQQPEIVAQSGAKNYDELMAASYRQMAKETGAQFDALPLQYSFHSGPEGYGSSKEMLADLHGNGHMRVYQGGDPHDFLHNVDPETGLNENEKFRAVHDAFGHGIFGNPFGAQGEELAWGTHSQMYSPLARPAMTAETRGQNSFVNYTPINADLKDQVFQVEQKLAQAKQYGQRDRVGALQKQKADLLSNWNYAPQKAVLLPPEFNDVAHAGGIPSYIQSLIKPAEGTALSSALTHFSPEAGLTALDPRRYGTGIPGDEASRLRSSGAPRDRSYFYLGRPGEVTAEEGLGPHAYTAQSDNLYDMAADPAKLRQLAVQANTRSPLSNFNPGATDYGQAANETERLAKEYGYEGVANPKAAFPMAAVFEPKEVTPYRSNEPVPAQPAAAKPATSGDPDLFDFSRLSEVPKVPQTDLPRYEPPRGVPQRIQDITSNKDVRNKMLATIQAGQQQGGANWYNADPLRDRFIQELGPEAGAHAFGRYMDYVAASSPRSEVGVNARNASYYYGREMRGEGPPAVGDKNPQPYGHMAQRLHQQNANTVAGAGWDPLQNPKPASFAQNLTGNQRPVTVDTHAFRLPGIHSADPRFLETGFKLDKDTPPQNIQKLVESGQLPLSEALQRPSYWQAQPKSNEYGHMERYYQGLAKELGITPAQAQASAWVGGGGLTGLASDESKPFLRFFQDRVYKTARETGMDPDDVLSQFIRGKLSLRAHGGRVARADGGTVDDPMGSGQAPDPLASQPGDQPGWYDRAVDVASRAVKGTGDYLAQSWPVQMAKSAATLPGDVYAGRVDPNSEEGFRRVQDLAGFAMTGGIGGAEAGAGETALGSGPLRKVPVDEAMREVDPLGYYSHGADVAANLPQAKGTPDQFKAMLQKQGVKPAEIEASGFDTAFADRPSVTKDEIAQHFQQAKPEVLETTRVKDPKFMTDDEYGDAMREAARRGDFAEEERLNDEWAEANANQTKFSKYTLPGGENYRETLLHAPVKPTMPDGWTIQKAPNGEYGVYTPSYRLDDTHPTEQAATEYALSQRAARQNATMYESPHWGSPNVLAHLRMTDRQAPVPPEQIADIGKRMADAVGAKSTSALGSGAGVEAVRQGAVTPSEASAYYQSRGWRANPFSDAPNLSEKVLHLEELQSDWGQAGRKQGFRGPSKTGVVEPDGNGAWKVTWPNGNFSGGYGTQEQAQAALSRRASQSEGVPHHPLVASTQAWTDLGLKRALQEAARGGHDRITWTPGEAQAARYDLSKQVGQVTYDPQYKVLHAEGHDGEQILRKQVEPGDIGQYIGQEAANKLLDNPLNNRGFHFLSGEDLKVGGEGMRGFYDKILPTRLKEITKKLDPSAKIEPFELPHPDGEGTIPAISMKVTPLMRERILKGLPAYARGGAVGTQKYAPSIPAGPDPSPTPAQILAGNYRKEHRRWNGLGISVETKKGQMRRGVGPGGKKWEVKSPYDYGYFKETEGADGDHVDVCIGPNPNSDTVFIVDQQDHRTGRFDEHKVLIGYNSKVEAETAYHAGFSDGRGPDRLKSMVRLTVPEFKEWLARHDTTREIRSQRLIDKALSKVSAPR